jgi:hypothetical protein
LAHPRVKLSFDVASLVFFYLEEDITVPFFSRSFVFIKKNHHHARCSYHQGEGKSHPHYSYLDGLHLDGFISMASSRWLHPDGLHLDGFYLDGFILMGFILMDFISMASSRWLHPDGLHLDGFYLDGFILMGFILMDFISMASS